MYLRKSARSAGENLFNPSHRRWFVIVKIESEDLMQKRGILQIAYYFPPIKTVGTLRNARFCQTATQHWSHISVITTAHFAIFEQENQAVGNPEILRIPSFDFRWLVWRFSGKKTTHFSPQFKKKPGMGWLRRALDSFPLSILLNDGGILYILMGYWRACSLIKRGDITHIYSSFRPISDHFMAFLLVRRYPKLVWIADFRDVPIDPLLKNVFFSGFQHYILHKILQRARVLTTVSEGLAIHLRQHYDRPVNVLYNAPLAVQAALSSTQLFQKFTMLYTGALYPGFQSAAPLFEALQNLLQAGQFSKAQIGIVVCGKDGALWRDWASHYQLEEILEDLGIISHVQTLELQRSAQINLLLSWNSPALRGIITSKVFEYFQAQKPILALINGVAEPELDNLIHTYTSRSLVMAQPWDQHSQQLEQFLQLEFQRWKEGISSAEPRREVPSWEGEMEKLKANSE